MLSDFKWIYFISNRINKVDTHGRKAAGRILSTMGIAFGVMALIVVMSVMNGFQMSFIDAIMEVTSYHVRVEGEDGPALVQWAQDESDIRHVTAFCESQALMSSSRGRQAAAIIRAIDYEKAMEDERFQEKLNVIAGTFSLPDEESIVLGTTLARKLGVTVGSKVVLTAMSGSSDMPLISDTRIFTVTGIFFCGYSQINEAYSFVNLSAGEKYFGKSFRLQWGIKLHDSSRDSVVIHKISSRFPDLKVSPWRDYNRSFFGALRIEKNVLLLFVLLIFLVVGINIFNSMRKMVFERRTESAVLLSFGARPFQVQCVFMLQGLVTGLKGAVSGLILGLAVCLNMRMIFLFLAKAQYYIQYAVLSVVSRESLAYLTENRMFAVYSNIPARIFLPEVVMIFLFGLCSSLLSSYFAGKNVLKLNAAEVLRDE